MEYILDKNGNSIRYSRNLRGIRDYVSKTKVPIISLDISEVGQGEGLLSILFEDGVNYQTRFACFDVLKDFVSRWRNVYGAPFSVNGEKYGVVRPTMFHSQT